MYVCIGSRVLGRRKKRGDDCIRVNCVTIIYLPTYSENSCIFLSRRRSAGERSHSPSKNILAFCFVWHLFYLPYQNLHRTILLCTYLSYTNFKKIKKKNSFVAKIMLLCKTWRKICFLHGLGGWGPCVSQNAGMTYRLSLLKIQVNFVHSIQTRKKYICIGPLGKSLKNFFFFLIPLSVPLPPSLPPSLHLHTYIPTYLPTYVTSFLLPHLRPFLFSNNK